MWKWDYLLVTICGLAGWLVGHNHISALNAKTKQHQWPQQQRTNVMQTCHTHTHMYTNSNRSEANDGNVLNCKMKKKYHQTNKQT